MNIVLLFFSTASAASSQSSLTLAISSASSIISSYSYQFASWLSESPLVPYSSHSYRINGGTISPYLVKVNNALSSSSASAVALSSNEVAALSSLDALLARAFDEVLVYIDALCGQNDTNGNPLNPVVAVGYYNVLYPLFSSQVSYFEDGLNTDCGTISTFYDGYSSLSSAYSHIAATSLLTQYCSQTVTASSYSPAPSVTLCSTTSSSSSSSSSASSSSSSFSSSSSSSSTPASSSSFSSSSKVSSSATSSSSSTPISSSSSSAGASYVESTQTLASTTRRCLAKVASSGTSSYSTQTLA